MFSSEMKNNIKVLYESKDNTHNKIITLLSCGASHAIAMTSDGVIYGWGFTHLGQTGVGKNKGVIIVTPLLLESFTNIEIKSLLCVYHQSFALTSNGFVYIWGYNHCIELGVHLPEDKAVYQPKLINNLPSISCIASEVKTTYFLTKDSIIYFCGVYGRDGFQELPKIIEMNARLDSLHSVPNYRGNGFIALGLNREGVFHLHLNNIRKSESKSFFENIATNHQMTHKTIEIGFNNISDILFQDNIRQTFWMFCRRDRNLIKYFEKN